MSSFTQTRQTKQGTIDRRILVGVTLEGDCYGTVVETTHLRTCQHTKADSYTIRRLPGTARDFGVCVEVTKDYAGETYEVSLSDILGPTCTCPAGTYNKGECKHITMARRAVEFDLI